MVRVAITIDAELSVAAHRSGQSVDANLATAIYGRCRDGAFGIDYQIEILNQHGLKAVFFVEALAADAVGRAALARVVDTVLAGGHEVQLHIHTEWLPHLRDDPLDGRRGDNMADFSRADQSKLIACGIDNLVDAGAPRPVAFRAGNFGADDRTLAALAEQGIAYDTSYNEAFVGRACRIQAKRPLRQEALLQGVCEVPVTCFYDYPRHARPAQLCAISFGEMRAMLLAAAARGRRTFVIVSHSFELLNRGRDRVNRIHRRRFERLCAFLAEHRARFPTIGFTEMDAVPLGAAGDPSPLASSLWRTGFRMGEQALSNLLYGAWPQTLSWRRISSAPRAAERKTTGS